MASLLEVLITRKFSELSSLHGSTVNKGAAGGRKLMMLRPLLLTTIVSVTQEYACKLLHSPDNWATK